MGYFCSKLVFNHTADAYFKKHDPKVIDYNTFKKTFGNEELALIIIQDDRIFSNEILGIIRSISKTIDTMDHVYSVYSITEQDESVATDDTLGTRKLIPEGPLSDKELEEVKQKALKNQAVVDRLISGNGTVTAIAFELTSFNDSTLKTRFMEEVMAASNKIAGNRVKLRFNGVPFFEIEESKLTNQDMMMIIPLMTLLTSLVIVVLFRSFTINAICLFTLFVMNTITFGLFALSGEPVNLVTSIMAAVLMNVIAPDLIHFIAHYNDELALNDNDHMKAVIATVKSIWLPCLFTDLTTAVGFFSFVTASIKPIQSLGIFTALGTMIGYVLGMTFFPAAFILFKSWIVRKKTSATAKPTKAREDHILMRISLWLGKYTSKHAVAICVASLVACLISLTGIMNISFKANTMNVFKESNPIVQDLKFIEKHLGGTMNSEISITAHSESTDFTHPESLKKIEKIQAYFEELKHRKFVSSSFSITDYFKEVNRAFNSDDERFYVIPDKRETLVDYYEIGDSKLMKRFVSLDRRNARITYQLYNNALEKREEYINDLKQNLTQILGPDYTYVITGTSYLWMSFDKDLKHCFMTSLVGSALVILLMMCFIAKGVRLGILSMIPNILPIMLTVALMGWLRIPFDTLSVMIACVTLGINVNDTIHFVVFFKRNYDSGMTVGKSIFQTFKDVGPSMISASVIMTLGFLILVFGSYKPFITFGLLTAFDIVLALFADLVLTPAVVLLFHKPVRESDLELTEGTVKEATENA
jgi:predicted RND superfamily exporter protein